MKKILFLAAVCLTFAVTACSDDNTQDEGPNTAPNCKITEPIEGDTYDASLPLTVKGRITDAENNITAVKLTVGGQTVAEELALPFFEYTVAPENLQKGALTIALYVEDAGGLSAQHQVTVTLEKESRLMVADDGKDELTFGYRSGERSVRVVTEKKWTVSVPEGIWIEFYDAASQQWVKKTSISGEGDTAIKLRAGANDLFEDRYAELKISTPDESGKFIVGQTASPDMLDLLEDEMLRMAAGISAIMYGMDANEDGKVSAYEAELVPEDGKPYGFDAGGWGVASTKGIENFPHLRHLDVNSASDELTEIDLSGNRELMSIHVHKCNSLKTLDLSQTPLLMELGCDYGLFLEVLPQIEKMKTQIHTLGIFNRKADQPSKLDFTGYSNMQRLHLNDNGLTEIKLGGCIKLWKFVASGNAFEEIDLSEVDRLYRENYYMMEQNPNLKRIYVWKGFTLDYYSTFTFDKENNVEIIEK